ncbi:Rhodanese- sulfurtransferase [Fusarium falciforme]|nr:Rhodanese- sulfurtransferase [Fusarium falciforme]
MALPSSRPKLPVAVEKPTPYTFDLGHLLAEDPNPVDLDKSDLEQSLAELARDGAQSLINQLLTTCPLSSTPEGVLLSLPAPSTRLPREKPVPEAKPPDKTREQRRNLAYDEESGEWKRKWGYKGLNKKGEDDWLVEVNPEKEMNRKEGTSVRGDGRRERKERVKRNERMMRKNERNAVSKSGKKK